MNPIVIAWTGIALLMILTIGFLIAESLRYWSGSNALQEQRIRDALEPGDFERWEKE